MKREKQLTNNLSYPLIGVIVFSLVAVVYIITKSNRGQNVSYTTPSYAPTQTIKEKIYRSKTLKFSIIVPSKFQVEERFTTILLKYNDELIQINRNGTNFENIEGYLNDLSKKNKITIQDERKTAINGLNAIIGTLQYPGGPQNGEKNYYLYNNYAIYSISTPSEALFSDLDQIAQSFRYAP